MLFLIMAIYSQFLCSLSAVTSPEWTSQLVLYWHSTYWRITSLCMMRTVLCTWCILLMYVYEHMFMMVYGCSTGMGVCQHLPTFLQKVFSSRPRQVFCLKISLPDIWVWFNNCFYLFLLSIDIFSFMLFIPLRLCKL